MRAGTFTPSDAGIHHDLRVRSTLNASHSAVGETVSCAATRIARLGARACGRRKISGGRFAGREDVGHHLLVGRQHHLVPALAVVSVTRAPPSIGMRTSAIERRDLARVKEEALPSFESDTS